MEAREVTYTCAVVKEWKDSFLQVQRTKNGSDGGGDRSEFLEFKSELEPSKTSASTLQMFLGGETSHTRMDSRPVATAGAFVVRVHLFFILLSSRSYRAVIQILTPTTAYSPCHLILVLCVMELNRIQYCTEDQHPFRRAVQFVRPNHQDWMLQIPKQRSEFGFDASLDCIRFMFAGTTQSWAVINLSSSVQMVRSSERAVLGRER
ncbi:hypothetical protein L218DRAFT_473066 [Marasmius fiardii PR-910]|nr:hypothetical protein L218DRAFT_473066 [Marasmius fiardii PR-910]